MDYISITGLLLIAAGWLIQFVGMNENQSVKREFVIVYALGVLVIIVNAAINGTYEIAAGNVLTFLVSVAVLLRVKKPVQEEE